MFPSMEFVNLLSGLKQFNHPLIESIEGGYSLCFEAANPTPTSIKVLGGEFEVDDKDYDKNDATLIFTSHDQSVLDLYNKSQNFKEFLISSIKSLYDEFGDEFKTDDIALTITTTTNVEGTSWTGGSKGSFWEPEEAAMFEDAEYETTVSAVQITVTFNNETDERTFEMPDALVFQDKKDMQILADVVENYLNAIGVIDDMLTKQGEDVLEEESFHRSVRRSGGRYGDIDY